MLWLCPGSLRCLDKRALTRYINIAQAPGVDCFRLNQKKKKQWGRSYMLTNPLYLLEY